jgi:hypothetical protein
MTRDEQELVIIDNRGEEHLLISCTHPRWTRRLQRLEQLGLARCKHAITATKNGKKTVLGGRWEISREVALRLAPRRCASAAQKEAAAKATAARLRLAKNAGATVAGSKASLDSLEIVPSAEETEIHAPASDKRTEGLCEQ